MISSSPFQNSMAYEYRAYTPPEVKSEPITPDKGLDGTQAICLLVMGGSAVVLTKTLHDVFKRR